MEDRRVRQRGNEQGPTARDVGLNLKRVRQERSLTQEQVSRRLDGTGHSIGPAAVGKIETGDRRVEVDDLMALAVALDVSPLSLLLPWSWYPDQPQAVTGLHTKPTAERIWMWAIGSEPLFADADADEDAVREFKEASVPPWLGNINLLADRRYRRAAADGDDG